MMLLLLYLNALMAASATTIWLLWAAKWIQRKQPLLALAYAFAAFGTAMVAFGTIVVILDGDPSKSAVIARYWVWLAIGAPALARLTELVREASRAAFADRILKHVEARADAHDINHPTERAHGTP